MDRLAVRNKNNAMTLKLIHLSEYTRECVFIEVFISVFYSEVKTMQAVIRRSSVITRSHIPLKPGFSHFTV